MSQTRYSCVFTNVMYKLTTNFEKVRDGKNKRFYKEVSSGLCDLQEDRLVFNSLTCKGEKRLYIDSIAF